MIWKTPLLAGLFALGASCAFAGDITDSLSDPKKTGWSLEFTEKTEASITSTEAGSVLKAAPRYHVMLTRRNDVVGSDANPLDVRVWCISENGFALHPGLHLYWDSQNFVDILYTFDNHVYLRWCNQGNDGARDCYHVAPDSKKNGTWLRLVVTTHNVFMLFSMDGENWQRLGELGGRPGREGVAPGYICLGRGFQGDKNNKDAHGQLCNDYYPDGAKNLIASTFKHFSLHDAPIPLPQGEIKIDARDSWEETEETVEIHGTPKTWTLLGPRPDQDFKLWRTKDELEPDKTDTWSGLKDEKGHPLRMTEWTRKDEDKGCYVDMGEVLEPNSSVIAWARAEIEWPIDGPANLFFDDNGRATVFLNGSVVFTDQGRENRQADKDRFCLPVHMRRGKNIIRVKIGQMRGDWGFFLRVDRTDFGHRIKVLEKLLELHPQEASGWRGAQAIFEIARRYQQLNNFADALSAWQRALDKFAANDELRVEAFAGKIRLLASLRNWDALAVAGDEYLKKYNRASGQKLALDAAVSGEALSGKADQAEARVTKWLENSSWGDQVDWGWRLLAGALAEAGQSDRQFAILDKLAAHPALNTKERACAAFEAAFRRYSIEQWRAGRGEKPDPARITAACQSAQKGLAVLPGASNPQVQEWMKEAAEDLKAGKHERALAGYWGAALMAYCASDPQSAPLLAMHKAYKLPVLNMDPKTNKWRELDANVKDKESWLLFGEVVNEVKMPGNWKAIGPFDFDEKNPPGPEKNGDPAAKHPGRGGEKAWVEVDPAKCWNDAGGSNLKVILGDCRGGVAYVINDLDVAAPCKTFFAASARNGWVAWLDGKIIATKGEDNITIEGKRVPVELSAGKHRIMLRLHAPGDDNFVFRAGFGNEPDLACNLLRLAWMQREYPEMRRYIDFWGDLRWLLYFSQNKASPQVNGTFGEAVAMVYPQENIRWEASQVGYEYMKRCGQNAEAANGYRYLLRRLETNASYGEQLPQIWACSQALYQCLCANGDTMAADEVLRDFTALHPDYYGPAGWSVVARGILREDFALTQASRPYFERAVREFPQASDNFRFAPPGLVFSKKYLPDRLIYNSSDEVQSAVDAASHLMKTGDPADIEKAMAKLGEIVRSNTDGLIRFSESRMTPRHVGVREYVRAIVAGLNDDMREVYLKTVAASSELALKKAIERKDIPALEGVAAAFHSTPAAVDALNLAGNLYLDRGNALQAAAAFRALQRQNRSGKVAPPLLAAKTARALLLGGQLTAAREAAQPLATDFAAQSFTIGGQATTGAQYAQILMQQIDRVASSKAQNPDASTETYMGGILRNGSPPGSPAPKPGEIIWSRPLLASAAADGARWRFSADPFVHLQSHPAVSKGRALISSLESVQAIDLESGRNLWQQSWDSFGSLVTGRFTGFPISCPTVAEGKAYTRALIGRHSALQCYAADSGKALWSTAELPELRNVVWIGEPLVAYGLCIAPYLEPADLNLHGVAAVDAATGMLRWKHSLATGGTGFEVEGEFFGTSMQLGPAAADERIVYAATGLGSLAALNAITGETIWLSGYPRSHSNNWDYGTSGEYYTWPRARTMKLFSRGAISPIVTQDLVILAPKDAPGLIGFDRRTGAIQWQNELLDSPYIAGVSGGNILTVDSTVRAIQVSTGTTVWEYSTGEVAFGQPALSGDTLYLPTEEHLYLIDAPTGKLLSTHNWDPRIGALGNLTVSQHAIVGVNNRYVAAMGLSGNAKVDLPLPQASAAMLAGTADVAAAEFEKAVQSGDADILYMALNGRVNALASTPQKADGLAEIDRVLNGKPPLLDTPSKLWKVSRDTFAESLRARLGTPPAAPVIPPPGINGALSFSWQLGGENPLALFPTDGPQDRFFAYAGTRIYCLRLSQRFEVLWQSYVGPGMTGILTSGNAVSVSNSQHVAVFDRDSGEPLWHMGVPVDGRHRMRSEARGIHSIAINDEVLAMAAGWGLFVYDIRTGRELWANDSYARSTLALGFAGNNVAVVYSSGNETPAYHCVHDARTGNRIAVRQLKCACRPEKWSVYDRFVLSPDKKLLFAQPYGVPRFIAFDMNTGVVVWESESAYLNDNYNWNGIGLGFAGPMMHYYGSVDNKWWNFFYDMPTGKLVHKVEGGRSFVDGDYLVFGDKVIARHTIDDKGVGKELWKCGFVGPYIEYNDYRKAFVSNGKLYLFIVRGYGGYVPDHFVLRMVDWQTGEHISDTVMAGTPLRNPDGKLTRCTVEQRGNSLIYAAREGYFVYSAAAAAENKPASIARLKQTLGEKDLPAPARRDSRRALNEIEPPVLQISPAPPGTRLDVDSGDPALVETAENFVPLSDDAVWNGPQDLSAKMYAAWNGLGIALAIDVKDDQFVPPRPGQALDSGDSIRVALNGMTDPMVINRGETMVISMALVDGRTIINTELETMQEDQQIAVTGKVILQPDGKSARYELFIPWELLRRDPRFRPGDRKDFRLGVAIFDNDGQGVKGAMEYGAGITCNSLIPHWLGRVSITDISKEKIERYRKVIAKLPGAPQSMRFLQQIVDSMRGAKAFQDRVAELETFVKTHPDCPNTIPALRALRFAYVRAGGPNNWDKVVEFAKAAKCSARVLDSINTKAVRVWVLPDQSTPPQTIMMQFHVRGVGWCRRAFWGTDSIGWGRENSVERMSMGPLPKPGVWTQLEVRAADLDMDGLEISAINFATHGGLTHFEQCVATSLGKETILTGEAIPPNIRLEGNPFNFVATPHHALAKAFTAGPTTGVLSTSLVAADQWFSFKNPEPPKPEPPKVDPNKPAPPPPPEPDHSKEQALYRDVAGIVADTPEGLEFLQQVIELYPQDKRLEMSIKECEDYLAAHPESTNANQILRGLHQAYGQKGDHNPTKHCDELIRSCKLPRDTCRVFYAQFAPTWMDWQILGPFAATSDRRGQDQLMPPEKAVDLTWRTKNAAEIDVGWTKYSAAKDDKGKPNPNGFVDLLPPLFATLDANTKGKLEKAPYFAYAFAKFNVPTKRKALLLYGVNDIATIWVNGRRMINEAAPGNEKDRDGVEVVLNKGLNEILVKPGVTQGHLGFFVRIADEYGRPFDDVTFP